MIRGELRVSLAALLALVTLVAFEALAVATAMPVAATDLGGLRHYGLAFSLFLTTSLLGMVCAGTWNDARGPVGPVLVGLAAFASGTALCGAAPTFAVLLVGRAVAGFGGGLLVVTIYVVVGLLFAPQARPRVFAWVSSAWVLPALVGPPVAGALASHGAWRAVFWAVAPMAVVVGALLVVRLRGLRGGPGQGAPDATPAPGAGLRRALAGVVLAAGAALAQGAGALPSSLQVVGALVGVAAVALALPRLVPVGTLRLARGLPSLVAARGLFTAAFTGAESYVPFMLVVERGMSPARAGLCLTTGAIGWAFGSFLLGLRGRWAVRLPRHAVMVVGALLVAACVAALVLPALGALPGEVVLLVWAVAGLGMGLGLTSTSVGVLAMSAPEERGRASSALQLSDALGSVVGIGAGAAALAATSSEDRAGTLAAVFGGLAAVALVAALASARVRLTAPDAQEPARGDVLSASVGEP